MVVHLAFLANIRQSGKHSSLFSSEQAIIQEERKNGKKHKFKILNRDYSLVYPIVN
jgi:hypothetical protein